MGCTISLTGEWGSGKTTFLQMWRQDLINHRFPTVLLNAWKTEWAEDPLIAVLSCMLDVINKSDDGSKQAIENVKKIVNSFIKKPLPVLGEVINTVVDATTGVDLKGVSDSLKKLSSEAFDEAVKEFNSREESIDKLKNAIEAFAWDVNQGSSDPKPLVFIIDELDRCRPDYSVRLLEVLKHFFEVKNIVFVCAIDKKHMEDAIRGYYGSENINATEYLKRFFDLEVELPTPDYGVFCKHLYEYYNLDDFFDAEARKVYFPRDGQVFIAFLASLASKGNLNLRQVERICAYTKLSLEGRPRNIYYYPTLSLIMTYIRFFDYAFYKDLKGYKLSAQEILTRFETKYSVFIDPKEDNHWGRNNRKEMAYSIGMLILSYIRDNHNKNEVFYDREAKITPLKSKVFSPEEINSAFGLVDSSAYMDVYHLNWLFTILDILKTEE